MSYTIRLNARTSRRHLANQLLALGLSPKAVAEAIAIAATYGSGSLTVEVR